MSTYEEPSTWTGRVRRTVFGALPPEKLLAEHQPVYVSSWVYVFGVLTIASLVVVVGSGVVLVIFGPTWWHVSGIGRFVNSLHLWSAEAFFFFMAIHLWAKFSMAAWRGRRALTWMIGAVCFLTAIATAFSGYLSQQNFDSQWISTQAKDGLNASGIGAVFNVLNTGQMLVWHVLLLPLVLIMFVVVHVLLVRLRGVVPPLPARTPNAAAKDDPDFPSAPDPALEWKGAKRRYDLIKELVAAVGVILLLAVVFAAVFSSPDEKPVTIARWANATPADFLATATSELAGASDSATYGPPYTQTPGTGQNVIDSFSLARLAGVRIPINSARDFVLRPLGIPGKSDPALAVALADYRSASTSQRRRWTKNYTKALGKVSFSAGAPVVASGSYGPVALMMRNLLDQARSGGLDGALLANGRFYQTDYTKPLLFLSDGTYLSDLAQKQNLLGGQWGMMNETGNYPGQAWLWLYTAWYQVPPFTSSANADAQIWAIMAILSLALVCVPFLPLIRSLPRHLRLYRLIWRDYYRRVEKGTS
ncbi:MAG TPA: cytochrome b N-terminal domain-containing protein [Gaiellaceae bacterium]|jgi:Cytochrome b(N-terminal)/b6/petB